MPLLRMALYLTLYLPTVHSAVFEFIPNTNLLSSPDWVSSPCADDRILISNQKPSAFYIDTALGINQINFDPQTVSEIIFGEGAVIYGKEKGTEESSCGGYATFRHAAEPPVWHDPSVWKNLNVSSDSQQPLLHSEFIPSQYDVAYFSSSSSHEVMIDLPIRVGRLISGGYSHTTVTMLEHIETVEGAMQFKLSPDIEPETFVDEIIMEVFPPVHVMEKECPDRNGCISYNLNSKIQEEMCKRVRDCPTASSIACSNAFRPKGHCCFVCGALMKFRSFLTFDYSEAKVVINETLKMNAPEGRFSLIKIADWQYQLVVIKGRGDMDFDENWIKRTTDVLRKALVQKVEGVLEDTITVVLASDRPPYDKVALGLGLFCLISLLIGVAIVGFKKKTTILNWFTGARIYFRVLWRDDGDRIQLEMANQQAEHSMNEPSSTSFVNPSFRSLLATEREKASGATVYETPVPTVPYKDKSGITFANPLFEGGAKSD